MAPDVEWRTAIQYTVQRIAEDCLDDIRLQLYSTRSE
jgi:hypothetical protein